MMSSPSQDEQFRHFLQCAWEELTSRHDTLYTQKEIAAKLDNLGYRVAESTLSKLTKALRGELEIAQLQYRTRQKLKLGLSELLQKECCLKWDDEKAHFSPIEDCTPEPVEINEHSTQAAKVQVFLDGRLPVQKKVLYLQQANKTVIEFGLRLHSLLSYFFRHNESVYRDHVRAALQRGVNFQWYLADFDSPTLQHYFRDRSKAEPLEWEDFTQMSQITNQLTDLTHQLNRDCGPGQIQLYAHRHYPYGYAQVIDPHSSRATIRYAPYLYAIRRADSPVLEVSKQQDRRFFNKLWSSVQAQMQNSVLLNG